MIRGWNHPVPAYAELHYAPLGQKLSRLWQPWPEIYLDLPWRVTRGTPLPVLASWADGHLFPVRLVRLAMVLCSPTGILSRHERELDQRVDTRIGGAVLSWLDHELDQPGEWRIWLDVELERLPGPRGAAGQRLVFRNQLAPGLPEDPLRTRLDAQDPPRPPGLLLGDPHVHSSGTRDMVEFGPVPELLRTAATTLGLDWFALTDHSYDLDDAVDDYQRRDAALPVWKAQQEWIRQANQHPGPYVLPGEECSVGGPDGGIRHLLLLDPPRFYAGSADGGESLLPGRPEWGLANLLEELSGTSCLPVSAHTGERPGRGERWLLRRATWTAAEMAVVPAHQVWSGRPGPDFAHGMELWRRLARMGRITALLAGGDSHGGFCLDRPPRLPLWRIGLSRSHLFGRSVTGVFLPPGSLAASQGASRSAALLAELRAGRALLGDGPLLWFETAGGPKPGGRLEDDGPLVLRAELPPACGSQGLLRVWGGDAQGEQIWIERELDSPSIELPLPDPWQGRRWLRAELAMPGGSGMSNALTPA